jgi:hypothetical protein
MDAVIREWHIGPCEQIGGFGGRGRTNPNLLGSSCRKRQAEAVSQATCVTEGYFCPTRPIRFIEKIRTAVTLWRIGPCQCEISRSRM